MQISLRVTSMGNVLMHEMKMAGRSDDPITMLYVDGDRLLLTHYCDAGNRPRMAATTTPDGKTVDFHFLDVANFNSKQGGYMQHAVFTTLDANHHTEDWTFLAQGKRSTHTSTCSERNDWSLLVARNSWKTQWILSGMTVNRFTASCTTVWSR